jgi:hypothetical protein
MTSSFPAVRKQVAHTLYSDDVTDRELGVPPGCQRQDDSEQDSSKISSSPSLTAISKDLPSDWKICFASDDDAPFFKNVTTNETSPSCPPLNGKLPLPGDWEMRLRRDGTSYFYKPSERRTSEVHPMWFGTDRLAAGQEVRFTMDGRKYFADGRTETTTWDDPRLRTSKLPWTNKDPMISLLLDPRAPTNAHDSNTGDSNYFFDFQVLY